MRGHEPLIAMRRAGVTPQSVWFDLDGGDAWKTWSAGMATRWKRFPDAVGNAEILVEAGDSIPRLDLRFVVGLQAWVGGSDERRVRQLHEACVEAGASRVLSTVFRRDEKGMPRTALMLDTAGHFEGAF